MAAAPPPVLPTTPTALRDRPPPAYMLGAGAVQIHLLGANELQAKNVGDSFVKGKKKLKLQVLISRLHL